MNIQGITPYAVVPQILPKSLAPPVTTDEITARPEPTKTVAETFYIREDEPWKQGFYPLPGERTENALAVEKEDYLNDLHDKAGQALTHTLKEYDKFRTELGVWRPELAKKDFGYTLDHDGNIKIIDYDNQLSDQDIEWLTDSFNEMGNFREGLRGHAKMLMTIVDHDTDRMKGHFKLDLINFQGVIDYAKSAVQNGNLSDWWIRQVQEKSEKLDDPIIDINV